MGIFGPPDVKKMLDKKDVNGLIKAIAYNSPEVQSSAVEALGEIGGRAANAQTLYELGFLSEPEKSNPADAAGQLLLRIGPPVIEPLLKLFASDDQLESTAWNSALGFMTEMGEMGIEKLGNAFRTNWRARGPIIASLNKTGNVEIVLNEWHGLEILSQAFSHPGEDEERIDAYQELKELGYPLERNEDRIKYLDIKDRVDQRYAAEAVAALNRRYHPKS